LYDELSHHQAVRYKELIEQGRTVDSQQPRLYKELGDNLKPTDLATIVYTSGSTGVPKGAMLNHENIIGLIHTDPFNWDSQKDSYISVLPLAHIFARSLNFIMIAWGISVYYVRDLKTIADVCREIHPTTFVLVPRILEKIYLKMVSKAENEGFLKRTIAMWAFTLANNEEESWYKQLLHPLADKVVYSSIRDALGGNLRVVISGGAALNPHLYHFFLDIGVPIFEGWGLTEAATVTCNRIGNIKIGTVGLPFEGMEVKISSEGEILVKGRIVMQGYFKNEEATAKSFTSDGWLRTGDKGHLDSDGFLTIEGRMKELYKSSTGEYIAPVPIEQELSNVPLIDMAMVIADGKKFASCLLFPNFDVIKSLKIAHNMENMSNEEFLNSFFVKEEMKKLFDNLNKHLNHWEEIRDYRFILAAPTVEGGELTPTMKIKREVIAKKYQNLIDSMYAQEAKI
jgi:long-chain acyl-CoA synthetase